MPVALKTFLNFNLSSIMLHNDLRIIYLGTPDFAVESLRALVEHGCNVVAVVTMPDKPAQRGHKIQCSPVKEYALSVGLPVLQPEKLKDPVFIEQLRSYHADLQIVVAFRMLPEAVWNMPRLGTFNLHASLLPQYRGAAPINWAVINGEKETGITTFFLKHDIDTGDIIEQVHVRIGENEDAGSLHDRLMKLGAQLVVKTVDMISNGQITTTPQPALPAEQLKAAPKIFKETCRINFGQTAQDIHNFVRGLSPHPAAYTEITLNNQQQNIKIYEVEPITENHQLPLGQWQTDGKNYLRIACRDGFVNVLSLQMPGKKRMNIKDFLNGIHL